MFLVNNNKKKKVKCFVLGYFSPQFCIYTWHQSVVCCIIVGVINQKAYFW